MPVQLLGVLPESKELDKRNSAHIGPSGFLAIKETIGTQF